MTKFIATRNVLIRLIFIICAVIYCHTATAKEATLIIWDDMQKISANIGKGQNRISFIGESIAEVVGNPDDYIIVGSQDGQIFLTPTQDHGYIKLSVITHSGKTQDLKLNIAGETNSIIIKEYFRHKHNRPQSFVDHDFQKLIDLIHKLNASEYVNLANRVSFDGFEIVKTVTANSFRYYGKLFLLQNQDPQGQDSQNQGPQGQVSKHFDLERFKLTLPNHDKIVALATNSFGTNSFGTNLFETNSFETNKFGTNKKELGPNEFIKIWVVYYE